MLNHPVTGITNASEWRCQDLRAEADQFRTAALAMESPVPASIPTTPQPHLWRRAIASLRNAISFVKSPYVPHRPWLQ